MEEFELIRNYFSSLPCARLTTSLTLGIGDDAALLNMPENTKLVVSTDTMVESVHFPKGADAFKLGQRALAAAVSDLAAMGASPAGFTLSLTLPKPKASWLALFSQGLNLMAEDCQLSLVGGDTTCGPLAITITVFGFVNINDGLTRSGAKSGDLLCVGGAVGDASGALPLVLNPPLQLNDSMEMLLSRYWSPQPQLNLGKVLIGRATAAIDISDGLLADCEHLAIASNVQCFIEQSTVPLSTALISVHAEKAIEHALYGGDDYILAFTIPLQAYNELLLKGWNIYRIGRITEGCGITLQANDGHSMPIIQKGYQHFKNLG